MEASVDNANFSNSNNSNKTPSEVLLNFGQPDFKQNGDSNDFIYHEQEKTNGKRSAEDIDDDDDDEDDDDDDDLGPETDVDAVDDIKFTNDSNNPFLDKQEVEKAQFELDLDLQKLQDREFDDERSPREETPTPPADAVHGTAGIDLLGADSGDDSEDEWNYIKVNETSSSGTLAVPAAGAAAATIDNNKENIDPFDLIPMSSSPPLQIPEVETLVVQQVEGEIEENLEVVRPPPPLEKEEETVKKLEDGLTEEEDLDDDTMSQLNPDAAEFVPVSPTRTLASPICNALIQEDQIIARSPSKPSQVDQLISMEEFGEDLKSRPKEFDNADNNLTLTETPANTEETLNKKNAEDSTDFTGTLNSTNNKPAATIDEFHFGPNAAPFTPKTNTNLDELSTNAVFGDSIMQNSTFGDDSSCQLGGGGGDPIEPVDLDKVQLLPDNLEELLNGTDINNDGENQKTVETIDIPQEAIKIEQTVDLLGDFKQNILDNFHAECEKIQENIENIVQPQLEESSPPEIEVSNAMTDTLNESFIERKDESHDEESLKIDDESVLSTMNTTFDNNLSNVTLSQADTSLLDTSLVCDLTSNIPNDIPPVIQEITVEKPDLILTPTLFIDNTNNQDQLKQEEKEEVPVNLNLPQFDDITPVKLPQPQEEVPEIVTNIETNNQETVSEPANEVVPVVAIATAGVAAAATAAIATKKPTSKVTNQKPPSTQKPLQQTKAPVAKQPQQRPLSSKPATITRTASVKTTTNGDIKSTNSIGSTTKKTAPVGTNVTNNKPTTKASSLVKTSSTARTATGTATRTTSVTARSTASSTARSTTTTTTRTVTSATSSSTAKLTNPRTTTTAPRVPARTTGLSTARNTSGTTTRPTSATTTNAVKSSTTTLRAPSAKSATSTLNTSRTSGTSTARNASSTVTSTTNNISKASLQARSAPKSLTKSPQIAPKETKTSRQRVAVKSPQGEPPMPKPISRMNGKQTTTNNTKGGKSAVPSAASAKVPLVNKTNTGGETKANQNEVNGAPN